MRASGLLLLVLIAGVVKAGTIYEVTATTGTETVKYRVKFGGGKASGQFTAFDPKTKTFVYLTWIPADGKPQPAGVIWDHRTGELVDLYKFPNVAQPLPAIRKIDDMKACPITGDKAFEYKRVGNYD